MCKKKISMQRIVTFGESLSLSLELEAEDMSNKEIESLYYSIIESTKEVFNNIDKGEY